VGPTVGLFGFLAQVNTVSTEKLNACTAFDISNIWPVAVLDISNIRPLKVKQTHITHHT